MSAFFFIQVRLHVPLITICFTCRCRYKISYTNFPNYSIKLTHFEMDLAVFLATRGAYAWLGYGWMGCGCGWEHNGKMPCDIYQRCALRLA